MKKLKVLAVLLTLLMFTNVHAALQSAPGFAAKLYTNASEFFKLIREMESAGGALGLNATFAENATTGEYEETSASNNVDAHMSKSTEWGAAAMLAVSEYGAGNGKVTGTYDSSTKVYNNSASTTGNITGIFGTANGLARAEYVAGRVVTATSTNATKYLMNAKTRYVDNYVDGSYSKLTRYIPGDATYEVKSFSSAYGYLPSTQSAKFIPSRGFDGILSFQMTNGNGDLSTIGSVGTFTECLGSRLVVWVGDGI